MAGVSAASCAARMADPTSAAGDWISCLKRDYGWRRTRVDGVEGARTWCGYGVFTHNLVKIGRLM